MTTPSEYAAAFREARDKEIITMQSAVNPTNAMMSASATYVLACIAEVFESIAEKEKRDGN